MTSALTSRRLTLAAAVVLLCATSAEAATFALTGKYRDRRGAIQMPLPPSLFAATGPGVPVIPNGTAMQTGAAVPGGGPATITLPKDVLFDPANLEGFLIPVPAVIQLSTLLSHAGPTTTQTLMANRTGPSNFAFCPGAVANPNCTTVAAGGSQGTVDGIVKYTAGPNKFGGTFVMLLQGTGTLTSKGDPLPPTVMTAMGGTETALPYSATNVALGGTAIIAHGNSYAFMQTAFLGTSPNTHPYGFMTTPKGLLSRGPVVGTAVPQKNSNTGFPMTTGQVYVYRVIAAQNTSVQPSKHTITGYDKRDPIGNGRIYLVSASLSRNYPADGSNPPEGSVPNRAEMKLTFVAQPALPLSSPAMLLTLGSLVLLSAGFAVSRKRMM